MLTGKHLPVQGMVLLAALSGGLVLFAGSDATKDKGDKPEKANLAADTEDIDKLVVQLGAASYQEREEAVRRLIAIGPPALGALRRIADDKRADPDVRLRAGVGGMFTYSMSIWVNYCRR